jgi:hypothetical protein
MESAGEGGMLSTVDDMLCWLAQMSNPAIGTPTTWMTMKTPQRLANGTSTGYGLGLALGRYRGVDTISHAGGLVGGNAHVVTVPASGLDIVVIANRNDVSSTLLSNKILDVCLPDLKSADGCLSRKPILGVFRSPTTNRVIHLFVEQGQQIASIDGYNLPVSPDEQGVFHPIGVMTFMKQSLTPIGPADTPSAIQLNDFGNCDELQRQGAEEHIEAQEMVGRYQSEMIGVETTISVTGDGARLTTSGRFGSTIYELDRLANGIWRTGSMSPRFFGSMLSFDPEETQFLFSTCRTLALPFRRRN